MKASDHLTRNQIASFGAGSLAASETRNVGGHLIRCVECRSLLPIPDSARVWTAITSKHDLNEPPTTRTSQFSKQSYLLTVVGLFGKRNRLAWAGGMLAVVVSLTVVFILSISNKQSVDTEIARSFELENPVPALNRNQANEINASVPSISGSDSSETNSTSTDRGLRDTRRKPIAMPPSTADRVANGINRNISSTRGAVAPCGVGKTIEVELGSYKTDLVLRWKPVPRAAKYHLYVSDDNEILVDEFETDQDTSYVLKKPLDPTKFYKWKIVITLESGEKLYVDAQKFTAKDFQSSLTGYKGKAKSNTRCLAN